MILLTTLIFCSSSLVCRRHQCISGQYILSSCICLGLSLPPLHKWSPYGKGEAAAVALGFAEAAL